MTLTVRHIRLRAQSTNGLYGTDIPVSGGCTIIHAPNTSGKSTVLQAMLYALGLEQMLSPRREIPLPYAMRTHVEDPTTGKSHAVIASYVAVELENQSGERITVRRNVTSDGDRRLVSVFAGPQLSQPDAVFERRDYFVLDGGAAQREAGFHRMLADFMDWHLPTVKRYDGGDCPLYVETIFPLFFVEQKAGWTSIPGNIPTHFRIRDVHRRAVEFLLDLDTHDLERRRQDLELRQNGVKVTWTALIHETKAMAAAIGLNSAQLPEAPTALVEEVRAAHLQVFVDGDWRPLTEHLHALQDELGSLQDVIIPEVESVVDDATVEADDLAKAIQTLNGDRAEVFRERQAELIQLAATRERLKLLEEDIQKNQDARKLQRYGSEISRDLSPNHCPTCEQAIDDALLPQGALDAVMSIDDNIDYLAAQRTVFKRLADRSEAMVRELDLELLSSSDDLRHKTARLRALKSDLIAPSHAASAAFIERRLRLEQRVQQLLEMQDRFSALMEQLLRQVEAWQAILGEKADLPDSRLSDADVAKIKVFEASIRSQLGLYRFTTFPVGELTVSEDTYRPEKEGFEIGFELSASDSVRLKWAYQMGLLDVALKTATNHPGLLVLDEPRQQEASEVSIGGLLKEAARLGAAGAQVIIATSERLETVRELSAGLRYDLIVYDGRLIAPLPDDR
ncbi:MAG: AAA family ATPase [Phenylobacterium sp.]|uniref:AAA family ATPase n=1 Tax=Phenylobacterium sp. TaxID=1871053 RepID=UPI00273677B7|nr:AAA family ATPase [Phenylobacterium sp.]MDP1643615.1 AAA family ATPase [Phenylobacterium sp.]MDP3115646.1 AAA family ATPase [Phenylobacterium sp.]